jgi:hypothetical protein
MQTNVLKAQADLLDDRLLVIQELRRENAKLLKLLEVYRGTNTTLSAVRDNVGRIIYQAIQHLVQEQLEELRKAEEEYDA